MTIRALGALRVDHHGEESKLQRAGRNILAVLIAAGPDGLSADVLAEEVWGDNASPNWDANLRSAIRRMRRSFSVEAIASGGRHYAVRLPPDQVDVWQLLDHASIDLATIENDRLTSLLADQPFPEPSESPLVDASRNQVEAARVELLDRICAEAPDRATPLLLAAIGQLTRTTWNEELLRAVVALHANAGQSLTATEMLRSGIKRLEDDLGAPVGAALRELSTQLDTAATSADTGAALPLAAPVWRGRRVRDAVSDHLPRHGLQSQAIRALDTAGALITGESGSGKTELAWSVAEARFESGHHIIWTSGQRSTTAAYAPIISLLPELAEALTTLIDDETPALAETARWALIQKQLRALCPDRSITFVVDDAQWLDSHTSGLVEHLARSSDPSIEVLIIGRSDDDALEWRDVVDRVHRAGVTDVTVGVFTIDELALLIGRIHPQSSSRQRTELAKLLASSKGDLPLVAAELIALADPAALTLDLDAGAMPWSDIVWADAVSEQTASIAAAAALAGVTWTFGDVLTLTDSDPDDLTDAIDELLDANLIETEGRPDRFTFRHVLIQEAFAAALTNSERRRLHRESAVQAERAGRTHDRARHLLAAGPAVDVDELIAAVVASAHEHLASESWLEAVRAFNTVEEMEPSHLDAPALSSYSLAIERSGGDASEVRDRAFDAAEAADDPELMLTIILDGVESGELLEGSPDRRVLLERIPRSRLAAASQFQLDAAMCRELGLDGQHHAARQLFDTMTPTTADERAASGLAVWSSIVGTPVDTWPTFEQASAEVSDDVDRARLRTIECERALALGDRDAFEAALDALAAEPASSSHPTRQWALHLLQSLRSAVDGDLTQANAIADAGFEIGVHHGLAGAFPARSAQVFAEHWVRGRHGDLLPLLEAAPPDVRESLLATAAFAAALFEHPDRIDDAHAQVAVVFERLHGTTQSVHATVAAILTDTAVHLNAGQTEQLRQLLLPHAGRPLAMSAGIAHIGPADRALARLEPDPELAATMFQSAVIQADSWNLPIWSIRCRLDLHDATGDHDALTEARTLADEVGLLSAFFDHR